MKIAKKLTFLIVLLVELSGCGRSQRPEESTVKTAPPKAMQEYFRSNVSTLYAVAGILTGKMPAPFAGYGGRALHLTFDLAKQFDAALKMVQRSGVSQPVSFAEYKASSSAQDLKSYAGLSDHDVDQLYFDVRDSTRSLEDIIAAYVPTPNVKESMLQDLRQLRQILEARKLSFDGVAATQVAEEMRPRILNTLLAINITNTATARYLRQLEAGEKKVNANNDRFAGFIGALIQRGAETSDPRTFHFGQR